MPQVVSALPTGLSGSSSPRIGRYQIDAIELLDAVCARLKAWITVQDGIGCVKVEVALARRRVIELLYDAQESGFIRLD
jgi:hypothetical protein